MASPFRRRRCFRFLLLRTGLPKSYLQTCNLAIRLRSASSTTRRLRLLEGPQLKGLRSLWIALRCLSSWPLANSSTRSVLTSGKCTMTRTRLWPHSKTFRVPSVTVWMMPSRPRARPLVTWT
eukprot:Rmarinus@m.2356